MPRICDMIMKQTFFLAASLLSHPTMPSPLLFAVDRLRRWSERRKEDGIN